MSYKTSPLLNRVKKIKGWKQSSFPIKANNYTRDIGLGFKIYLLLKAYLSINNFRLLLCQLRTHEKNIKVVHIMLLHSTLKRKQKKKIVQESFLTSFRPLQKPKTKLALYLLYNNITNIKELISYHRRITKKHLPSTLWWKTLTTSNWINLFLKRFQKQSKLKKYNQEIYKRYNKYIKYHNFIRINTFNTISYNRTLSKFQKNLVLKLKKNEYAFFTLEKIFKTLHYHSTKNHRIYSKIYLNCLVFLKKKLWLKYIQIRKTTSILSLLRTHISFRKDKKIFTHQPYFKHQLWGYSSWTRKKYKNTNYLEKFLRQLTYYEYVYEQSTYNNTFLTYITQTNWYLKTYSYNIKMALNKIYFSFILKTFFNFHKLLALKSQSKQNKKFIQSQTSKNYLILLNQYSFFLKRNYIHFNPFQLKFTKMLYLYKFLHSYRVAKKKRKNQPPTQFKLYKFIRKFWSQKMPYTFSQVKSSSILPSFTTFAKLLSWKKKIRDHAQFLKNLRSRKSRFLFYSKKQNIRNKYHYWIKKKKHFSTPKLVIRNKKLAYEKKNQIWDDHSTNISTPVKKLPKIHILQYQIPYRIKKRALSSLLLKYRLKKALQDFLKKYLQIHFQIKINNSIHDFKNLQFYRLFFKPTRWKNFPEIQIKKMHIRNTLTIDSKSYSFPKKDSNMKQENLKYIYLSTLSNHLLNTKQINKKANNPTFSIKHTSKSNNSRTTSLKKNTFKVRKNLQLLTWKKFYLGRKKKTNQNNRNPYRSFSIKTEKKNKQKNFIFWDNQKKKIIKRTLPLISVLKKYFDIQLIVNHIAWELEYTRNQWIVLSCMKKILTFIASPRLKAYQISIFGRINSKSKARKIILKEGKIPLQIFKRKINFAMAQTRAKIGTFGIKMWIYF